MSCCGGAAGLDRGTPYCCPGSGGAGGAGGGEEAAAARPSPAPGSSAGWLTTFC